MLNNTNQQFQNINYNPYGVPAIPNYNTSIPNTQGLQPPLPQPPQNNLQTSQDANNFNNLLQNLQSKLMGSGGNGNQLIDQIQGLLNNGTQPVNVAQEQPKSSQPENKESPLTKEGLLGLITGMMSKPDDQKEIDKKLLEIYSTKAMESLIKNGKAIDAKMIAKNAFDIAQNMIDEFKNRTSGNMNDLQMSPEAQENIIENV